VFALSCGTAHIDQALFAMPALSIGQGWVHSRPFSLSTLSIIFHTKEYENNGGNGDNNTVLRVVWQMPT